MVFYAKDRLRGTEALEATGTWVDVTPGDMSLSPTIGEAEVFGAIGATADPSRSGAAFVGGEKQGIWETTDAGLTWTKIYTAGASSGFDGSFWSMVWAPSGAFGLSMNGYGTSVGVWRTTNRGLTWTQIVSDDTNIVTMSPSDENHILVTSHGITEDWYESTNGGASFTNIGNQDPGIWYDGAFLSDTVWIGIGPNGLWRGVKSGSWTWTNPVSADGPHGGAQMYRDGDNGYFYVGASTVALTRKMYRTTLADTGVNWTEVGDFGGGYGVSTVWGGASRVYAHSNFATQAEYSPSPVQALRSAGQTWTSGPTTPAGMTNGAHHVATVQNAVGQTVFLASCDLAGVWRYVEP